MDNVEFLLSDEFVKFSEKIKEIHDKKKVEKEEIKALYAEHQRKMKALEHEAVAAQEEFETWKNSQLKSNQ